jgi:peptidoglycan/xylan/chitin deacetylase (PgdA/CDA1 family)
MIGAAGLVAAAGLADLIRMSGKSSPAKITGDPRALTRLLTGTASPTSTPVSTHTPTSAATHHATGTHSHEHVHGRTAPHSHAHSHQHGHQHPTHSHGHRAATHHHHSDGHVASHGKQRQKEEHVTLPPPVLQVRSRPAYQVDQLIPSPPPHTLALTIDDGPNPDYTPSVLRLLDKYEMQASFCVVGVHAEAYPWLVRDIHRAGHVIVNHSYTHMLPFNRLTEKRIVWEITKTQHTIERAAGVMPQLFRAPGGDWSHFIYRAIASYGLEPLDWDVDPRDWARPGTKAIQRRMLRARPGEIVLCHDGGGNRAETVRALRRVLPTWGRRGITTMALRIQPHYTSPPPGSTSPTPT